MRKIILNIALIVFIMLPLILWLTWVIKPSREAKIMLMDKTVLTRQGVEHRAFNWVLAHRKYLKPNGTFYTPEQDYLGFFPLENDRFQIKDLSRKTDAELDSLSDASDMVYLTDMYGIYENDWYHKSNLSEHSPRIYGGLHSNDVRYLRKMKEKNKLIMAEFNLFATPTPASERAEAEQLLGLKWTGWTGRYFEQLDTLKNPGLPRWVVRLYKQQHHAAWPFTRPGIVFVHEDETIAILEKETDLKYEVPLVKSFNYGVEKFGIPKNIRYPYWFDITLSTDTNNRVISYYEISPTKRGDSILHHHNIPAIFPAAFENIQAPYYYFCGDFTDIPVNNTFEKLIGMEYLKMFVINKYDLNDRTPFFWRYYLPMTSTILDNYFDNRPPALD